MDASPIRRMRRLQFEKRLADVMEVNRLRHTFTWGRNPDLDVPRGTPVRVRFAMRASKLFAFQFAT